MNRQNTLGLRRNYKALIQNDFSSNQFETSEPTHFALFAPLHYEPNYAYPLLVWLHGPESNETQLRTVMPHVSLRNYVGIAARGTVSCDASSSKSGSKQSLFNWGSDRSHFQTAERRVMQCVEMAMQKYNISNRRVFIAGLEDGGTMAMRIGLQNPDIFAGALSLGGAFPKMGAPLSQIHKSRSLPLFMTTTRDSVQYPVPSVCDDLRLFHTAGLHVTLRQYPGADEVTKNMLSDMDRWLMDRISQDYQPEVESLEPTPTPGY